MSVCLSVPAASWKQLKFSGHLSYSQFVRHQALSWAGATSTTCWPSSKLHFAAFCTNWHRQEDGPTDGAPRTTDPLQMEPADNKTDPGTCTKCYVWHSIFHERQQIHHWRPMSTWSSILQLENHLGTKKCRGTKISFGDRRSTVYVNKNLKLV